MPDIHYCHPPQLHFRLLNTMLLANSGVKLLTWAQRVLCRSFEGMQQPSSREALLLAQQQSGRFSCTSSKGGTGNVFKVVRYGKLSRRVLICESVFVGRIWKDCVSSKACPPRTLPPIRGTSARVTSARCSNTIRAVTVGAEQTRTSHLAQCLMTKLRNSTILAAQLSD